MPSEINLEAIRRNAKLAAKATEKAVGLTAQELWGNIRENSPVDHGRLAGSWSLNRLFKLQYKVSTAVSYARAQNDGTGIYGPKGRPITSGKTGQRIIPKNGKVLVFQMGGKTVFAKSVQQKEAPLAFKIGGRLVYAMSVKGVKGKRYIEKSIQQTEDRKRDFVEMALEEVGLI